MQSSHILLIPRIDVEFLPFVQIVESRYISCLSKGMRSWLLTNSVNVSLQKAESIFEARIRKILRLDSLPPTLILFE